MNTKKKKTPPSPWPPKLMLPNVIQKEVSIGKTLIISYNKIMHEALR